MSSGCEARSCAATCTSLCRPPLSCHLLCAHAAVRSNWHADSCTEDVCLGAAKMLTFIDMGGHERCLKTAMWVHAVLL